MKNKIINIILVLLSLFTIVMFSQETAVNSTKTSKGVTKIALKTVVKDEKKLNKLVNNTYLKFRKMAHFIEYTVLGFLLINLLKDYIRIDYKLAIISVLLALLFSISDEIHQTFIVGRSGEIRDVCIDTLGSSLGVMSYYLIYNLKINKKKLN